MYACVTTPNNNTTKKLKAMDNIMEENIKMKPLETHKVELESRGSLGLQLLYKYNVEDIVKINRLNTDIDTSGIINPGDSLMVVYEITAQKKGIVKITFYETQPWNKDFKEIIKKEINIKVE
jgi:hypothetical protein